MSRTQFEAVMSASKRVFVPGASGEPQGLLDLLSANPTLSQDTTYVQFPIGGMNRTDFASLHPTARMETFSCLPHFDHLLVGQDRFSADAYAESIRPHWHRGTIRRRAGARCA